MRERISIKNILPSFIYSSSSSSQWLLLVLTTSPSSQRRPICIPRHLTLPTFRRRRFKTRLQVVILSSDSKKIPSLCYQLMNFSQTVSSYLYICQLPNTLLRPMFPPLKHPNLAVERNRKFPAKLLKVQASGEKFWVLENQPNKTTLIKTPNLLNNSLKNHLHQQPSHH